jgi:hypothetical protein
MTVCLAVALFVEKISRQLYQRDRREPDTNMPHENGDVMLAEKQIPTILVSKPA